MNLQQVLSQFLPSERLSVLAIRNFIGKLEFIFIKPEYNLTQNVNVFALGENRKENYLVHFRD